MTIHLGRTDNELCPVSAIAAYMVVRGREEGPFFHLASGAPLSREVLVRRLRAALGACGIALTSGKVDSETVTWYLWVCKRGHELLFE